MAYEERQQSNLLPKVITRVRSKRRIIYSVLLLTFVMLVNVTQLTNALIEIRALNMPERVENGSRESIVLDCVYSLDESKDNYKLVVKWFFKDDPVPIYQWIPEFNSRTFSRRFENKINKNFSIPHGTTFTKYRAVNLVNITTDLSGTYSCHVASLTSQDSKKKDLIVYASPKKVSFGYKRLSLQDAKALAISRGIAVSAAAGGSNTIKNGQASPLAASSSTSSTGDMSPGAILRCAVENVFPKPDLMIYAFRKDGSRYPLTSNVRRREELLPGNRAHSVYLSAQIFDSEISRKYLEDGYHTYSSNYNYHPSSPIFTDQQHPFQHPPPPHLPHPHLPLDNSNSHSSKLSSSLPSSTLLSDNLNSNSNNPSYRFECVSTIDVKLTSGNLTKTSSITYTPASLTAREDSDFFNFKASSTSSAHRPTKRLLPESLLPIFIFIFITQCTVKLSLSTASIFPS